MINNIHNNDETSSCVLYNIPATSSSVPATSVSTPTAAYDRPITLLDATSTHAPALDVDTIRIIEQELVYTGTSLYELMKRAGRALAQYIIQHASSITTQETHPTRITIMCGNGNNGGDGWVAGYILAHHGMDVHIISAIQPNTISAQPAHDIVQDCLNCSSQAGCTIHIDPSEEELAQLISSSGIIIDAILGTGFNGADIRAPFNTWISCINTSKSPHTLVISADIPSGMNAQTGGVCMPCVKAHTTITMIANKKGLLTPYAFAFAGDVYIAKLADIASFMNKITPNNDTLRTTSHTPQPSAKAKSTPQTGKPRSQSAFLRAENEDDDGYDPYSDRRPEPEPLFNKDPWA